MQVLFKSWFLWLSGLVVNAEKQSKRYFCAYLVPGSLLQVVVL